MDASPKTIFDIFNGSRNIEVPFFQRAYVWDEPQWERMLEDVEDVCLVRNPYFLGSVILKQKPTSADRNYGDVRTVIDGQQRLTTLSILLKVLCLKTGNMPAFDKRFRLDDNRTVLQHNHNDIQRYTEIMDLEDIQDITHKDNISRCYQFFVKNLDPNKVDFMTICNFLIFVGVDLMASEDEQQIFDTINSLGVRLTTAELLKNYFFDRNEVEEYKKYWLNIFEKDEETKDFWDQEITTGRIKRTFIDIFFFSFLQIKIQDRSLNVRAEDKILFSKVEKLFDSYKYFIRVYCADQKFRLLEEIRDYAIVFRRVFNPDVIYNELPSTAGIERINAIIFALDTTTLIPYVLYAECNEPNESLRNDIYGYIESYIMRRLVTRLSTKNYNRLFTDRFIHNEILSKEQLVDYIDSQDDKVNRMPSNTEVLEAFHESILTNKYATGVLYLIESKIRDRRKHSTQLLGIKKYSLEHVMPKKWRNNWEQHDDPDLNDRRDRKLLTLGNLSIITQSLNTSIRDSSWHVKKTGQGDKGGLCKYSEGIETLSSFLTAKVWDEQLIESRANYLAKNALETWPEVGTTETDHVS